jgi:hypothetical protein
MHIGSTSVLAFPSRTRFGGCAMIVRVGLAAAVACAPVTAALAQGTQAPQNNQQRQTESQRQPTPGRLIVPVTASLGTAATPTTPTAEDAASTPTPTVTGSFSIQRFARTTEEAVAAVGTLTLSLEDPSSNAPRTIVTQVAMPLARSGDTTTAPATSGACETLSLVLGPLDLNLLAVAVRLEQVNVELTVVQGAGERLGNLLCDATRLIDRAAAPAELVKTLNTLLDTIG